MSFPFKPGPEISDSSTFFFCVTNSAVIITGKFHLKWKEHNMYVSCLYEI